MSEFISYSESLPDLQTTRLCLWASLRGVGGVAALPTAEKIALSEVRLPAQNSLVLPLLSISAALMTLVAIFIKPEPELAMGHSLELDIQVTWTVHFGNRGIPNTPDVRTIAIFFFWTSSET